MIFCRIAWNEMFWSAWKKPCKRPVSCCGKKPFGIVMNKCRLNAIVTASSNSINGPWRKAQAKERP